MEYPRTVFVVGAGASYEYGFPVGAGLRRSIIQSPFSVVPHQYRGSPRAKDAALVQAKKLAVELSKTSERVTIDAFLDARKPTFLEVGKHAIAGKLLPVELD